MGGGVELLGSQAEGWADLCRGDIDKHLLGPELA